MTIKFGIITTGMIANFHARSIQQDPRAELVAVCGHKNRESTQEFAKKYDVKKVYMDYKAMAADPDIDAVCVCSPSGMHGEHTISCIKGGKHVLCEKPLEIKSDKAEEMIDISTRYSKKLGCVFPNRTGEGLIKAKRIVDSGVLGRMLIVECQYRGFRPKEYFTSSKWKGTKSLDGGGCLMNQGIHAIDTMCWLTGDIKSVYSSVNTLLRDIEVEDEAMALIDFVNGAKGVLMGTTLSNVPLEAPEGDLLRIEFERGTILYSEGITTLYIRLSQLDIDKEDSIPKDIKEILQKNKEKEKDGVLKVYLDDMSKEVISSTSDPANLDLESHAFIVSDFVDAILEDKDPYITGESAKKSVDLVLAIYESSKTGGRVFL